MHLLQKRGATVTYSDPFVPSVQIDGTQILASEMDVALPQADCAVIITDHSSVDYQAVVRDAQLVVDTRNALRGIASDKIIRL